MIILDTKTNSTDSVFSTEWEKIGPSRKVVSQVLVKKNVFVMIVVVVAIIVVILLSTNLCDSSKNNFTLGWNLNYDNI